jgi:large subunit ribosomal protein L35
MSSTVSRGIWSNLSNRSKTLSIKNPALQNALLSPNLPKGPISLKAKANKLKYNSPIGLNKIYPLAYQLLEKESEKIYNKIEQIEKQINESNDVIKTEELYKQKLDLLVKAELENPEVVYNSTYSLNSVDRTQPVYRYYLKEQWKSYKRMLTMQRLETLTIIPDTLPTLEPEVDVRLKFPHNNIESWIEPGSILSSNVTSKPPSFEIIEFKESIKDLYTVLIVNPDTPDVENDTYSTTLHWGLKDVELSNTDSIIDIKKLNEHPEYSLIDYLPPVPEKNLGNQRFAVWVFRQNEKLDNALLNITRENFDIRKFVEDNKLTPIGAHVWRSSWDLNTENVRKTYGLPAGRIFSRDRI